MTRINLIPVKELSDQHLVAEYRELPRIVNAVLAEKVKFENIPEYFRLGEGHVKFFYNKILFLVNRYHQITTELEYRDFSINPDFAHSKMLEKVKKSNYNSEIPYEFSLEEIQLSRNRIMEKINKKPQLYKWTKRKSPEY